jgi:perosamine synthetase
VRAALGLMRVERVPVGSDHFTPGHRGLAMSPICWRLLERFDYAGVIARRRENYARLAELLGELAPPMFAELGPGVCPLFYPTRPSRWRRGAPGKAELVARLRARGIEAIDFWSGGHADARGRYLAVDRLREEVLELPIHQDLDVRDLEEVARAVREALHA